MTKFQNYSDPILSAEKIYENTLLSEGAEKAFTFVPLAVMSVVTLIGLVVHSQEPGLLTNDKNTGVKKKE